MAGLFDYLYLIALIPAAILAYELVRLMRARSRRARLTREAEAVPGLKLEALPPPPED